MSATVSRRGSSLWALMSRSSLPRAVTGVQPGDDPVQEAIGDLALAQQRQVVARAIGLEDADPVRVRPEPGAGLGDIVGHEQVDALAPELVRGAIQRTGL